MNIINQLEQTVTPAILGANESVAHVSLLEQFYAILASRLAVSEVYTQLQRNETLIEQPVASSILFEQLWQQPSQRQLLIQELAMAHHVAEATTEQLIVNAASLAYQELKNLANGQFLPAFLQAQQPTVRQFLPTWATAVVSPVVAVVTDEPSLVPEARVYDNSQVADAVLGVEQALSTAELPVIIEAPDTPIAESAHAIYANPSEHHTSEMRVAVRRRHKPNDLLVPVLLLIGALLAIALVWALFFKENDAKPVEPVVAAPIITEPETVVPSQILTPAQLMIRVDNNGNLDACNAIVGDASLQAALTQALMTSFADQANMCQILVQEGVATTLTKMNIEVLPSILNLMRTTPFSRLQMQNDSISLEAPDNILLQGLLLEVRNLVPTMTVTSVAPIALAQPPANTYDETYNNNNYNNGDYNNDGYNDGYNEGAMQNNSGPPPITNTGSMITNQPSTSGFNNQPTARNNQPTQPSGSMSLDEADNLTNPIISERLPDEAMAE